MSGPYAALSLRQRLGFCRQTVQLDCPRSRQRMERLTGKAARLPGRCRCYCRVKYGTSPARRRGSKKVTAAPAAALNPAGGAGASGPTLD
eukprot:351309-Chlamydomonas_euryale.AAC.12